MKYRGYNGYSGFMRLLDIALLLDYSTSKKIERNGAFSEHAGAFAAIELKCRMAPSILKIG